MDKLSLIGVKCFGLVNSYGLTLCIQNTSKREVDGWCSIVSISCLLILGACHGSSSVFLAGREERGVLLVEVLKLLRPLGLALLVHLFYLHKLVPELNQLLQLPPFALISRRLGWESPACR